MKNRTQGALLRRLLDGLGVVLVVALLATGGSVRAAPEPRSDATALPPLPMNEQVLNLPGDPARPVTLQVTLFMPYGAGPFPLAVVNHGAAADGHPRDEPRYRTTFSADYFLSRGYAVVLPMMRGFAGSGGKVVLHRCDLAATGLDNARDIAAVIDAMAGQPKIDTSRIVVAGQSFGGWNTLALGTLGHRGVKGLVNFSGGIREGDCRFSDQDASLADGAGIFGARTRVPSIWFYGDNDMIFPESTWRAMYARYTAAGGGRAELVAYGNFMDDAHQLLSHAEGFPIWTPKVDAFLARIGLPATPVYPGYMPTPLPPATHYADVQDATAVPYLSDNGRAYYQKFLDRPFTRALAVAPNGFAAAANGGFDPIAMALGLCRQRARDCQLYAVDNDVVWTRPGPRRCRTDRSLDPPPDRCSRNDRDG